MIIALRYPNGELLKKLNISFLKIGLCGIALTFPYVTLQELTGFVFSCLFVIIGLIILLVKKL
jgi:hypothetical protein